VADRFAELEQQVEEERSRAELLGHQVAGAQEAAYGRVFRQLMDVMRAADAAAAGIRSTAEREAKAIVEDARTEAGRIIGAARSRSVAPPGPPVRPDRKDESPPMEVWWGTPAVPEPEATMNPAPDDEGELPDIHLVWDPDQQAE
jgi:cell division septum initiation protein DivIVA